MLPVPRQCPNCAGQATAEAERLGTLEVTLQHVRGIGPECYDLFRCPGCELIYLSPLPPQEVLDTLYIHNLQFDCPQYQGDRALHVMRNHRRWLEAVLTRPPLCHVSNRWLRAFLRRLPIRREVRSMLEVGSGLSWMCRAAKSANPETITVAQDISSEASPSCPWVDHFVVGSLDSRHEEIRSLGPYQLISMSHVIEHLPDPVHALRMCSNLLHRKGIVFISAPSQPVGWRVSSSIEIWRNWELNQNPAHLQYFNQKSMERCARQSGLWLLNYEPNRDDFIAWLGHVPRFSSGRWV